MIAQLEQHLSSVAVLIPNELISQAGLDNQSEANVSVRNGVLVSRGSGADHARSAAVSTS